MDYGNYNVTIPKRLLWLDTLIIFLNLSTSYSIIPYLLFGYNRFINLFCIIAINLLYIVFRIKAILIIRNHVLFYLYLLINIFCLIGGFVTKTGDVSVFVYLVSNLSFYYILYSLFGKYTSCYSFEKSVFLIMRGYIILSMISVLGSVLMFTMAKMGINPYQNLFIHKADLFFDNYNRFGTTYYYPYHLSILTILRGEGRIPFFQDYGVFTGLYHEPHIQTFMTFPAMLFLFFNKKSNIIKTTMLFLMLFLMFLSVSSTNLLSFTGCIILVIAYNAINKSSKVLLWIIPLAFVFFILYNNPYFGALLDYTSNKMDASGSKDYSNILIRFAFTPKSIWGGSFYNTQFVRRTLEYGAASYDVGGFSFIINILFMTTCVIKMIKLFFRSNGQQVMFALFIMMAYFFLHSFKVAMISYSLSMLIFMCFLLTEATHHLNVNGKN